MIISAFCVQIKCCVSKTGTNTLMVLLFRVRNNSFVLVFASCVPPAKEYVVDHTS